MAKKDDSRREEPLTTTGILPPSSIHQDLISAFNRSFGRFSRWFEHLSRSFPARATLLVFVTLIALITGLLVLPVSTASGNSPEFIDALFTAVSAVCVTGLTTVDTATYWSGFGQGVIALAMFVGGLGVMTLASLLALAVSRHLGLTQRMLASDATGTSGMSDLGRIIISVFSISIVVVGATSVLLFGRLVSLGFSATEAAWDSVFMAISSFNNAGFVSIEGGAARFISDWGFFLPIILAAMVGAVGFPVISDILAKPLRPRRWTLHTKLTLTVFFLLVAVSIVSTGLLEWNNPQTLGALSTQDRMLESLLAGINSRSLGVSAIDVSQMNSATIFLTDIFMFIGGGSASTAGGIKVTTLAVLILAVVAEARGSHDVEVFRRRLPFGTVRLAVSVLVIAVMLILTSTFLLLLVTDFSMEQLLFESISAFATVGLSMGITPDLPVSAKFLLSLLMLVGRLGPMTLAAALALRERRKLIRMPEARPIVG